MASKRDLVEAHDFNRRRLVTAFLSGAPGGREVEPVRHGRTVVGGVVLAALLVAGAAVSGVLKPTSGDEWRENGLVIGKTSGSRFMMIDDTLYPVANITSARLILDELTVSYVEDDLLVDVDKGPSIGIVNAPDFLPAQSDLVQTSWVTCTNGSGGLRTTLQPAPAATTSDDDLVVRSTADDSTWIVAGDARYPLPEGDEGTNLVRSLGLDRSTPLEVTDAWLDLLDEGTPIAAFDVPDAGDPSAEATGNLSVIGTPVTADGQGYVLVDEGLVPLNDFAYAIYRASPAGLSVSEQEVSPNDLNGIPTLTDRTLAPADWPSDVGDLSDDQSPCLVLQETDGDVSAAMLATAEDDDLLPTGQDASVSVAQGRGAVVSATTRTTGSSAGSTYLIDPRGTRYAIVPREFVGASLDRLGYGDTTPVQVPRAWADLFADGPDIGPYLANQVIE